MFTQARSTRAVLAGGLMVIAAQPALAHFQQLIPSHPIVTATTGGDIDLSLTFTHPMEGGPVMEMERPERVGVMGPGVITDLSDALTKAGAEGAATWSVDHVIPRPGAYAYFVQPAPYWEPAEGKMIVHYAKTVVNAYGWGADWDRIVGLPVEIEPLTRPYGLWTGNLFTGRVIKDDRPVPFAEVEVEWINDGSVTPPNDAYVTQVVKADAAGKFSYAMPRAGWWGFAALVEAEAPMENPEGEMVPVEEGGLIWVHTRDMR